MGLSFALGSIPILFWTVEPSDYEELPNKVGLLFLQLWIYNQPRIAVSTRST